MTSTIAPPSSSAGTQAKPAVYQNFLSSVVKYGYLDSDYDARDIAEVVFRAIRDVMPNEVSDQIAAELEAQSAPLAELWRDTNPLVRWLSQVRPVLEVKDNVFVHRIRHEAGVPKGVNATDVMVAVFGAVKEYLSTESSTAIARCLPGQVRLEWNQA